MRPIDRIHALLDTASVIADEESQGERYSNEPFTSLAQLIDTALARAKEIKDNLP